MRIIWTCILFISISFLVFSQSNQSSYFKNFVNHADGNACTHKSPDATFTAYLNDDESSILIENAPRWDTGGDPNISGNGTFGVELGNFINPSLTSGDSVFIRFTCNVTGEQAILSDSVSSVPFVAFPQFLQLKKVNLPAPPQDVSLIYDSTSGFRTIIWTKEQGITYNIYRRVYSDVLPGGEQRMLYSRMKKNLSGDSFTDSTAQINEKYGYIIYAVNGEGVISSHSKEVNENAPPGADLTIGYIARFPRIDYTWGSNEPSTEGWPAVGSTVTWQAHVKNWSGKNLPAVQYIWYLDSTAVDSGTVAIPAESAVDINYPWKWTFSRHTVEIEIDPHNLIPEEEEQNNSLMIYTNAIGAGFYVEQSVYDYFRKYQKDLGVHSNCWEDWAQRHVSTWNKMFANAIYPETPNGVIDRIRIDKITVVPDGSLPLAGGLPTNDPNMSDRTIDLQWGFPATLLNNDFYKNHSSISTNNAFYFEGSLLHELGHARYLIDVYGFNVSDDGKGSTVGIKENGQFISGTSYMPLTGNMVYTTPYLGLMNGQYTYIGRYSAGALNLITGDRATLGNYNAPGNIGVFMQDLPAQNQLQIEDESGNPLPGANVKVFQASGKSGEWYGKYFDNIPDLDFTADSAGDVLVGRCPFSKDGKIVHTYGESNSIAILRIFFNGKVGYTFISVANFNMAYWRGNTQFASYKVKVHLITPTDVSVNKKDNAPKNFDLAQNYPNPFNPTTTINYSLSQNGRVSLKIFDALGGLVKNLVNSEQRTGTYSVMWDGKNNDGLAVPSGIYLYRLKAVGKSLSKKMILLK